MYDYVTTKPELNEETLSEFGIAIQHGYLKDSAAKAHKYLKRWKNAAGKWVYQYKKSDGRSTYLRLDERENDKGYPSSRSQADIKYGSRNASNGWSYFAPVKGLSDHGDSRSYSKDGINRGISAGRKRAAKKGAKIKGYSGNLTQRGFSGSQGSGESKRLSNLGTRKMYNSKYNKAGYKNPLGGKVNPYYFEGKRLQSMSKKQMKNGYKVETYNVSKTKKKKSK